MEKDLAIVASKPVEKVVKEQSMKKTFTKLVTKLFAHA
jgi:hypothetical protein